jgi:hypothetical protein
MIRSSLPESTLCAIRIRTAETLRGLSDTALNDLVDILDVASAGALEAAVEVSALAGVNESCTQKALTG